MLSCENHEEIFTKKLRTKNNGEMHNFYFLPIGTTYDEPKVKFSGAFTGTQNQQKLKYNFFIFENHTTSRKC